jgi:hypothetical protein
MKKLFTALIFFLPLLVEAERRVATIETDVLVIGGGAGGTAAAIQCARMGIKTMLAEPTSMLGGMLTAAGVSCTDGNDQISSGIWEEFRQALYKHYGTNKLDVNWVSNTNFEPHVGDSIFKAWAAKEKNLEIYFGYEFERVVKNGNHVTGAVLNNEKNNSAIKVKAKVVIDATELGDVLAATGADYDLGMDDPKISGEKEGGQKNNIIQDLTWVAIVKEYSAGSDKTIDKPTGYDPKKYYCCCADAPCDGQPSKMDKLKMLGYGKLPFSPGEVLNKYMINWPIHGNDTYLNVVEDNYKERNSKYELAKQQTLGFIYFMQTELGMKHLGLADDELNNGLAWIPYNREGRRVKGVVRMNIDHIKNPYNYTLYRTGIAVGDYPVDHHHGQYPGDVPKIDFPAIPSYNLPLGCLIPANIEGLIVCEKGISVTNIVNGTTRLQPVVLLTGQAAGILAAKSIKEKKRVRDVAVRSVQEELLKAKCYLMPFVDVKPDDPNWEAIQKIGVTGILKGTGKAEGWANKMFFYPDSTITDVELAKGLFDFEKRFPVRNYKQNKKICIDQAWDMIVEMQHYLRLRLGIPHKYPSVVSREWKQTFKTSFGEGKADGNRLVTRKELAVMLNDMAQNPFGINVNINGILILRENIMIHN